MASDNQHVIVKTTNGNFAATSYGPRKTTKNVPLHRPVRAEQRSIIIQMDGDVSPALLVDLADDALSVLRKGDFVTDAYAFSETGAAITLGLEDRNGVQANLPPLAPAANGWIAARDVDVTIGATTQIYGTIGAGETAVVVIKYFSAETQGDGGVLHRTRDNALEIGVDTLVAPVPTV